MCTVKICKVMLQFRTVNLRLPTPPKKKEKKKKKAHMPDMINFESPPSRDNPYQV